MASREVKNDRFKCSDCGDPVYHTDIKIEGPLIVNDEQGNFLYELPESDNNVLVNECRKCGTLNHEDLNK